MTDIVIVNWNSGKFLNSCIESVFAGDNSQLLSKVIIIDNNSSDDSLVFTNTAHNKVEVNRNDKNIGFAKACNQGFKKCTAEYVLLLNPDARLQPATLRQCTEYMGQHKDIDILGCSLYDDNNQLTHSCSRFPTPARIFFDACGLSKIAPAVFKPATIMTDWDHKQSGQVNQLMGAFMFIRKKVFEKIGYFDERFFVYYEETDFSKRLSDAGGVSFYNSNITAFHSGEGTTKNVKAFRLFLNLRSRLLYSKKHFSLPGYIIVWCSTFFIEPFTRALFLLLKGKFAEVSELAKGFWLLATNGTKHISHW